MQGEMGHHHRVGRQKPQAITKQKSEQEKKLRNRNADRAKQLGIEYKREINTIKNKVIK